ncbi:MAG: hypothetical protein COB53_01705 [Elusimicrobia bacterium]|nr:MAG: hypothetical protein COB53_01705 [Elusimicrobiota bacterium]
MLNILSPIGSSVKVSLLAILLAAPAHATLFPHAIARRTLDNGLDVLVVETPAFPQVLSVNTLVLAGSRNEVEAGKTGLAHLFEHILFRHRFEGKAGGYGTAIDAIGAHNNAWTWFDVTYYHPLSFSSNLERLIELEADRFMNLDFTKKTFENESGAVLGEYRNGASFPTLRLSEKMLGLLFKDHPYGHTTIGTREDVVDMPNEFLPAKAFYRDYYRPNNTVLIVTGDVRAEDVFAAAERRFKDWKRGKIPVLAPASGVWKAGRRECIVWDSDVAPYVWVGINMPAFRPGSRDGAVMEILGELLVTPAAPMYKTLRYDKKSVSELKFAEGSGGFKSLDPRSMTLSAKLYKDRYKTDGGEYLSEVEADLVSGLNALKKFSSTEKAAQRLERLKSRFRYDFLGGLSSSAAIASTVSQYYRFGRDLKVFEHVEESLQALRPEDIDAFASRWFTEAGRVVVTLVPPSGEKKK